MYTKTHIPIVHIILHKDISKKYTFIDTTPTLNIGHIVVSTHSGIVYNGFYISQVESVFFWGNLVTYF